MTDSSILKASNVLTLDAALEEMADIEFWAERAAHPERSLFQKVNGKVTVDADVDCHSSDR